MQITRELGLITGGGQKLQLEEKWFGIHMKEENQIAILKLHAFILIKPMILKPHHDQLSLKKLYLQKLQLLMKIIRNGSWIGSSLMPAFGSGKLISHKFIYFLFLFFLISKT